MAHVKNLFCEENYEAELETRRQECRRRLCVPATRDRVLVRDGRVLANMLAQEASSSSRLVDYCSSIQTEIAAHMRKIVTDWMLEVCEDQQCPPQVFFLATTYLDTFLSRTSIRKNQFQLLASVCLLLASKFSCVVPVTTDQLVIYTDNSVTKEELHQWELHVLCVLQWELSTATVSSFLDHLCSSSSSSLTSSSSLRRRAETIASLAVTEYKFLTTRHSLLAAAALAAATQQTAETQQETEEVITKSAAMLKCSASEVTFLMEHVAELSPPLPAPVVVPSKEYQYEYFTETKNLHSTDSSLSLTPTDSFRFEVLAA